MKPWHPEMSADAPPPEFPERGRLVGIDFGTVQVGIAVCDAGQTIAGPWATYRRRTPQLDAEYFRQVVGETDAVGIVVGLPIHISGDESEKSIQARQFGEWLREITGLQVVWQDERFSTAAARQSLSMAKLSSKKMKAKVDQIAAHVILQSFLDSSRSSISRTAIDD